MNRTQCPNCDSDDTEREHIEWYQAMVEEVRNCNDCETQFTNEFTLRAQVMYEQD